jgi:acyl-CoA synthetase (AMP-forming)/AMP-acid ligase II
MQNLADMATLADIPRHHATVRPGAVALEFEGRVTTYADLDRHTNQVANALTAAGLSKGDRVAYLGKNSDHFFEILFGAAKAGVVLAPVGWRLAAPEAAYIQAEIPGLAVVALEPVSEAWPVYEVWRDAVPGTDPEVAIDENDVAFQLYTSGTTGHPKGALLRHRNLRAGWREADKAGLDWNTWTADDISLVALPLSHIGGAGWGIVGLVYGAHGVVVREFDPGAVPALIQDKRISKLFMVPPALQMMLRHPGVRDVDYGCLRHILYGATPIPLDLLRECMEVFGCGFVQLYGMTETCGAIVYLPPEDHDAAGNQRMLSAGLPMPGVEIRIIDEAGEALPIGAVGEVATRSASNMAGYWNMADATAQTISTDGWLRTGDAGYIDGDGYLFLHDRVKDMIITGGENVYPAEVENAIYGHPDVAEVAVIGIPDVRWGEAVKAVVATKPGCNPTAEDIIAFARTRIAGFKVPKSVDFIAALPRNTTGKVLRRELREPYWAGRTRRVN